MSNIKNATFTSVWDGETEVETACEVNIKTKEVFNIQPTNVSGIEVLDKEYITIGEQEFSVTNKENYEENKDEYDFWY